MTASLTATSLPFSPTYVGARRTLPIVFRAGDAPAPTQVTVELDNAPGFEVTPSSSVTVGSSGTVSINVSFAPMATGSFSGTLVVRWAADPSAGQGQGQGKGQGKGQGQGLQAGQVQCSLSGAGLDPVAPLVAEGAVLDFRTLVVGGTESLSVRVENPASVTNTDDEPCTLTPSVVPGADFTVTPASATTVSEGGMQVFTVTFAPTGVRTSEATLSFAWTRAGLSGTLTVDLKGVGVAVQGGEDGLVSTSEGEGTTSDGEARLRAGWYVPTHSSYLSAGQAWSPDGVSGVTTQPGLTASTTRHIFLRADGSVTFQSKDGPTWFQSEQGPLYLVSGNNAYFVSKNAVYVGGAGYVGLMSGFAGAPISKSAESSYDDQDPSIPAPIDKVPPTFMALDLVFEITDKIVNISTAAKTIEQVCYFGKRSTAIGTIKIFLNAGSQTASLSSYIYGKATGSPMRTANFFAQAGLLMGTPGFCSIYGTLGANYRSANVTLLGNATVTVNSLVASTLDSLFGETAISGANVAAESWTDTFVRCTLGEVTLLGKDIEIGRLTPDGMQVPTLDLKLEAASAIDFEATKFVAAAAPPAPTASGGVQSVWPNPGTSLKVDATESVGVESPKTVIRLNKAPGLVAWTIEASPAGISIKSLSGEVVSLKPGMIKLGGPSNSFALSSAAAAFGTGNASLSVASITISGISELL